MSDYKSIFVFPYVRRYVVVLMSYGRCIITFVRLYKTLFVSNYVHRFGDFLFTVIGAVRMGVLLLVNAERRIMPRDAVSRTAHVGTWLRKRNGGHKWVNYQVWCVCSSGVT